ncbi:MAG: CHAT domain-containing protein, partial [Marmoricola sp.]
LGAGGGDDATAAPPPAPVTRSFPPEAFETAMAEPPPPPPPTMAEPPEPPEPAMAEPPAAAMAPAAPVTAAPAESVDAHLAAEMPGHVVAEADFTVRVRLSRHMIVPTDGAAHADAEVQVDPSRPLSVQVVGKKNATVTGTGADVFALPPGGGTSELTFTAQALAPGDCVVTVVVKQGAVTIGNLTLTATAVPEAESGSMPLGTMAAGEMDSMIDAPELEDLPCIEIYEQERKPGQVTYLYNVRLEPGTPVQQFESLPMRNREKKIAKILDDVAKVWRTTSGDPTERERKLQDIGAKMFDELFPVDMQAHLWSKRSKVKNLLVYADEPFVPWELVHLKPPTGPREEKARFLAQGGLVRWQPGSLPPREMRVRRGKARSLVPAYKDPLFALTEPVFEEQFLVDRFEATKVTATPNGVRTLLRSGEFDLFHFSGHGAADPSDILDAKLLLQGLKRAGTVEPQYLGATTVSENASWAKQGAVGPVVVLNACQAGQAGELLTTVGGFAKAFLVAGASAFVSCLWSVHEQPSRVFVEKLYDELLAGTTISQAATKAREAARMAGDATWLAFVVYARPDAVLVMS